MGRRTAMLVAAIVVAALGTTLVFMYANRAEDAALAGQQPVEVLVATAGIAAGTTGSSLSTEARVELKKLPAAAVPANAISDLTPVAALVTTTSIFPGQVILRPMFGTQQETSGGLTLPKGTMGVAVKLGDPERVAGFVKPGSDVAIFVTTAPATVSGQDEAAVSTSLLLERVRVIAVGPTTISTTSTTAEGETNTEEIPMAILTLALTQAQAQQVILANATSQMHFALLDKESQVNDAAKATTLAALQS